jgi:hypothetical protein
MSESKDGEQTPKDTSNPWIYNVSKGNPDTPGYAPQNPAGSWQGYAPQQPYPPPGSRSPQRRWPLILGITLGVLVIISMVGFVVIALIVK